VSARAKPKAAKPEGFSWSIKTDRIAHLAAFEDEDWRDVSEVIIDISREPMATLLPKVNDLVADLGPERVRLALPAITRAWEQDELLGRIRKSGWRRWEIANLSGWQMLETGDIDLATDWPLHVTNRESARALLDAGVTRFALSPEDGLANWRTLLKEFGELATVIVHQDTPLFISETRALASTPGEETRLVSSFGDRLRALDVGGRTVVVDEDPYCISDRLDDLASAGARTLRVDFVWREYSPALARERWRAVRSGATISGARIANFDRGLT
jgi:hypothetical protein